MVYFLKNYFRSIIVALGKPLRVVVDRLP